MIEYEKLKELIKYDPITGNFYDYKIGIDKKTGETIRREVPCRKWKSKAYGMILKVDEFKMYADKVAYFIETGRYPEFNTVIHLNGDLNDNRWENLKLDGEFKLGDVFNDGQSNKWRAFIKLNGERVHLGLFYTKKSAEEALATNLGKLALFNK